MLTRSNYMDINLNRWYQMLFILSVICSFRHLFTSCFVLSRFPAFRVALVVSNKKTHWYFVKVCPFVSTWTSISDHFLHIRMMSIRKQPPLKLKSEKQHFKEQFNTFCGSSRKGSCRNLTPYRKLVCRLMLFGELLRQILDVCVVWTHSKFNLEYFRQCVELLTTGRSVNSC